MVFSFPLSTKLYLGLFRTHYSRVTLMVTASTSKRIHSHTDKPTDPQSSIAICAMFRYGLLLGNMTLLTRTTRMTTTATTTWTTMTTNENVLSRETTLAITIVCRRIQSNWSSGEHWTHSTLSIERETMLAPLTTFRLISILKSHYKLVKLERNI